MDGNVRAAVRGLRSVVQIDLMFFYTSFFCSGTQSMVSQLFFEKYYPDNKYELLTLTLFLGAIATLAGLLVGKRLQYVRSRLLPLCVLAGVAGFAIQMKVSFVYVYVPAFMLASFSINVLYNIFDNFINSVVDDDTRPLHIKMLLLYQMLGYVLSPLFFSLFIDNKVLCIVVVALLGVISYLFPLLQYSHASDDAFVKPRIATRPIDRRNRFFLAYVISVFSGVYIFLAIAEYLLADNYKFENPALVCSIFLMFVILISCVVIVLASGSDTFQLKRYYLSLILLGISALILLVKLSTHLAYLVLPCMFLGIGYGLFLSSTKHYVNCSADSIQMISLYNISQTIACLCAYAVSYVTSRFALALGTDPNTVNLVVIMVAMIIAALILTQLDLREKKESRWMNASSGC